MAQKEYRFAGFTVDVNQRKIRDSSGSPVNLNVRAFDTLLILLEHHGSMVSKQFLMEAVWPSVVVEENNLNQAIFSLRKALGDSANQCRFVQTVPGRGFIFIAPVEVSAQAESAGEEGRKAVEGGEKESAKVSTKEPPQADTEDNSVVIKVPVRVRETSRLTGHLTGPVAVSGLIITFALLVSFYFFYLKPQPGQPDIPRDGSVSTVSSALVEALGSGQTEVIPDSIAVLPFSNLTPDAETQVFAIGLHDEVINQLSKISSLNVISRHSVLALGNGQHSLAEIGRLLRVESVMTGNIMITDAHARISLQLLDPETGVTLWVTTYDADTLDLNDMMSIQSDVALNVVDALEADIKLQEQLDIEAMPTSSFEAYRYNLAARKAYYDQDYEKAWTLSKQALKLDSNFIDALQNFASVNTVLTTVPLQGMTSQSHFVSALESANRIIALEPDRPNGYALKAFALSTSRNWSGVEAEVERLRDMGYSMTNMQFYALLQMCLGNFQGAIETFESNLRLEPINLFDRGFLLIAYELAGNRMGSREAYELGEDLSPVWWGDTMNLFLSLGRNEPVTNIEDLPNISDETKNLLYSLDDREKVLGILNHSRGEGKVTPVDAFYYGVIAASVGENELAISFMRTGLEEVWISFFYLWLPVFDEARQLESFRELLSDSGIVDYWQENGWPEMCQPKGDSFSCDWQAFPD